MSILDLSEVARLEEARLARGMAEIADEARPCGGGMACRGAPGVWSNTMVGMGFAGEVTRQDLEGAIEWYEAAATEPRAEVCPFAHESLVKHLEDLKFSVRFFESVFFREITGGEITTPNSPPSGLRLVRLGAHEPEMLDQAARVVAGGFAPPGATLREEDVDLFKRCALHARTAYIAGILDDQVVGAGGIEFSGEIAALFGLSVHPEYRRRGVQQAILKLRLELARDRGVRVATISSRPGVATERNVRRMGFQVAYTKAIVVRPREGLTPSRG